MVKLLAVVLAVSIAIEPVQMYGQQPASADAAAIDGFNRAVLKAARQTNLSRAEMFKLRTGLAFNGRMIRSHVASKLWAEGKLPDNFDAQGRYNINAIDWDSLIEFIERLLPLIIDFIETLLKIFGSSSAEPGIIIGSNVPPILAPHRQAPPAAVSPPPAVINPPTNALPSYILLPQSARPIVKSATRVEAPLVVESPLVVSPSFDSPAGTVAVPHVPLIRPTNVQTGVAVAPPIASSGSMH